MSFETKTPKPGEWWSDAGEIIFVIGRNSAGHITYERAGIIEEMDDESELITWHHEPRCTGFDWVQPPAIHPGEGWELLPVGTVLQDGDEFFYAGTWVLTGNATEKVGCNTYRRKIKPAEVWPKWYVLDETQGQSDRPWAIERYTTDKSWRHGVEEDGSISKEHNRFPSIIPVMWKEVTEAEALARVKHAKPVESPDDWVTQDRVPVRPVFDECRWSSWVNNDVWIRNNDNTYTWMHGRTEKLDGGKPDAVLSVRCRRKDLPEVDSPDDWVEITGTRPRKGIDQIIWDSWDKDSWMNLTVNWNCDRVGGGLYPCGTLRVRCRRKDLPAKQPATVSPNDWPEDASHENGNYESVCLICHCKFTGHKRRVFCRQCVNKKEQPATKRVPVRLWCPYRLLNKGGSYQLRVTHADETHGSWYEILHDAGGFYVEVPE
jgi:hypothetical protein